jgi:ribosomal protein S14
MKYHKLMLDLKKREFYKKTEIFQKVFKVLFLYSQDYYFRLAIKKKMYTKIFKNNFKSHIKNYCIITGRSRSVYTKFKVSRITFRDLANKGVIFGLKKAS